MTADADRLASRPGSDPVGSNDDSKSSRLADARRTAAWLRDNGFHINPATDDDHLARVLAGLADIPDALDWLADEVERLTYERDDYAARLKGTAHPWSEVAAERDAARQEVERLRLSVALWSDPAYRQAVLEADLELAKGDLTAIPVEELLARVKAAREDRTRTVDNVRAEVDRWANLRAILDSPEDS